MSFGSANLTGKSREDDSKQGGMYINHLKEKKMFLKEKEKVLEEKKKNYFYINTIPTGLDLFTLCEHLFTVINHI